MSIKQELALGMDVSNVEPGMRQAAVAISESGELYRGAFINSQSSLLDTTAAMSALYNASQHQDYPIEKIVVMSEAGAASPFAPVTSQFIIDYARRSGRPNISLEVRDEHNDVVAVIEDARELSPFYAPLADAATLDFVRDASDQPPQKTCNKQRYGDAISLLRAAARTATQRAFVRYNDATRYGSAVETPGGIYFGGQYGSYDGRTNIHAEMGATILARLDGETIITAIGIASPKFAEVPAQMCGCCRQFMHEMTDNNPTVHMFGWNDGVHESMPLSEYLPATWSNQR